MKKRFIALIFLMAFFILLIGIYILSTKSLFTNQVNLLLSETNANYKLKSCSGGWFDRTMYCNLIIPSNELNKVIANLSLDQQLPYFENEKRIIYVSNQNTGSLELREKYVKSFGIQQWVPSRQGFSSAMLFYDKNKEKGCLFLSIGYG